MKKTPFRHDADQPVHAASGPLLRFSLPGEWVDRRGQARPRLPVRRMAVIKPDHIGDLLIAARAFRLLRHFFPSAVIDLICGPWNVELARQLGVFDAIHGVELFHEVSGEQSKKAVAAAARRQGIERLQSLALGPYDVAIDLRYDRDSRSVLQALDARVTAGFGQRHEFPFLDIAMPVQEVGCVSSAPPVVVLPGGKFHRPQSARWGLSTPDSGRICVDRSALELTFVVTGAKSPAECGIDLQDRRALGIGVESITALPVRDGVVLDDAWHSFTSTPGSAGLVLASGWSAPESWGAWGLGERCSLRFALPPFRGETHVRLDLSLVAYVNRGSPQLDCVILAGSDDEPCERVSFTESAPRKSVSLLVPRRESTARLVSEPFSLSPGAYEGSLRLYLPQRPDPRQHVTISLRAFESGIELFQRQAGPDLLHPGLCDIPLACWVEFGHDKLLLEIEANDALGLDGARVELLTLHGTARLNTRIPPSHMEARACMLVLQVALEFSDEPPFGTDDIAARLSAPPPESRDNSAFLAAARLRSWRQAGACLVGLAMGCSSEIRRWPTSYYIELARELVRVDAVRLVFLGNQTDQEQAVEACADLGLDPALHSLCGAVSLADLGQVLRELDVFIGNNTGTTHYAGRVGVRTIGIYAGTNHPKEFGPVGPNTSWLFREEPCAMFLVRLAGVQLRASLPARPPAA